MTTLNKKARLAGDCGVRRRIKAYDVHADPAETYETAQAIDLIRCDVKVPVPFFAIFGSDVSGSEVLC